MAKEKKRSEDSEKKDLTFYYEIVGIITIMIATITLARLGNSGQWLMIFFRLLFGDWYFLILVLLMLYGLRSLVYHKPLEIKTMRFMGIVLFMVGLLTISHFPMHNYVIRFGDNPIQLTIDIYGHFLKTYEESAVLGGGIIGGACFYLFYTLFGAIGAAIIAVFIMMVGVAYILKKTLKEFTSDVFKVAKGGIQKSRDVFKTLKYDIAQNPHPKTKGGKIRKHRSRLNLKLLGDNPESINAHYEDNTANNVRRTIGAILSNMSIFYRDVTFFVSYNVTTFIVDSKMSINIDLLGNKLKDVLEKPFFIKRDNATNQVIIELNNTYPQSIDLKNAMLAQSNLYNNYLLPVGFNYKKELLEHNLLEESSLLVIGDSDSGMNDFVSALVLSLYFKNIPDSFMVTIIDLKNHFSILKALDKYHLNLQEVLPTLKGETEEVLEKLSHDGVNSIEEYNKHPEVTEPIPYHIILLSSLEEIIEDQKTVDDLIYLMHIGKKCGIMVIATVTKDIRIPTILNSMFDDKVIFWNNFSLANDILGFTGSNQLEKSNDAFFKAKATIERIASVMVDHNDVAKIMSQL